MSKEYGNILTELVKTKRFEEIPRVIEGIKYEAGGEIKAVEKLETLKKYLKTRLERYTDLVEVPGEQKDRI